MKFPTYEEMAQNVAEKALDEYEYKGRTIRQWIEIISASEHGTNLASLGTDAISRQQAINTLERAKQNIHHNIERAIGDAVCEVLDAVENGIKQLPPIHPVNNSEMPNGSDVISRQAAIDALSTITLYKGSIPFDTAVMRIEQLPPIQPAEPKRGRWILDRSGAYCCSKCMEPCAGYVMMKPRDKFCKMCGAKMEVNNESN